MGVSADVPPERGPWSRCHGNESRQELLIPMGRPDRGKEKTRWQEGKDDPIRQGCSWSSEEDHLLMVGWGQVGGSQRKWEPRWVWKTIRSGRENRGRVPGRGTGASQTPREYLYLRPLPLKPRPSALASTPPPVSLHLPEEQWGNGPSGEVPASWIKCQRRPDCYVAKIPSARQGLE